MVDEHVAAVGVNAAAGSVLGNIVFYGAAEHLDGAGVDVDAAAAVVGYVAKSGSVTADGSFFEVYCAFFEVDAAAVAIGGLIVFD